MLGRRAYICYTRADRTAALRVRRALQRFAQQGKIGAGGGPGQPTLGPIVCKQLDQASLDRALLFDIEASDWLILICSPAGATPAMEAAAMAFKARGRAHRIIAVVTGGEPAASRTASLSYRECLPQALLFATDAVGALTDHPVTPAFVDLRPDGLSLAEGAAMIAGRIAGAPAALFRSAESRRRRRNGLIAGAAAAAALAAVALAPVLHRDMEAHSRAEAARAAGIAAHEAMDEGRRLDAVITVTRTFPKGFDFANPPYPVPDEALSALNRAALETRALTDMPAPASDIVQLVPSPDGAVIAVGSDAAAYLVDLGAGAATQVYDPGEFGASRVSADGATLWTARFGAETKNRDGDAYAPLIFEDVDLISGEITTTTAVQSLPPRRGSAAISPDGARFAVDIGPGHTDRTLIGVFSRAEQALVGVATLPAARAEVSFLAPDRLLLTTNPPNIYGDAPGLYLWNLSEDRPRVLRAPGRTPLCPGVSGASRRVIAAEIAAGRLPSADWVVSGDGGEVALLLPSAGGGSCLLRWSAKSGRPAPIVVTQATYRGLAFAFAGGPYAALTDAGDLALITPAGEARPNGCSGSVRHFETGGDPLVLCQNDSAVTLYHGYSGARMWRGPDLPRLTAAAYDAGARRLIMAREDGRISVWDAAARSYVVARGRAQATLMQPDRDHVALLVENGPPALFDLSGRPATEIDPALLARLRPVDQPELLALAATGAPEPPERCAPLVAANVIHRSDSPTGRRAAVETADGIAIYDRATCLPVLRLSAKTVGSGPMLVSDDLLWAPLAGEVAIFPLSIPAEQALDNLHARAPLVAVNGSSIKFGAGR